MNILLDIDGVICEYQFDKIVKDFFGVDLDARMIYAYDLADVLGVSNDDINTMFQEQVYGEPNFIKGAIKTLEEWVARHSVYIYTNRTKYMSEFELLDWLDGYGIPFVDLEEHPRGEDYDYHIDDSPAKLMNVNAKNKLLFNQPWNEGCLNIKGELKRVYSWEEINDEIP